MKRTLLLVMMSIFAILQSCTLEQQLTFNKDYSGSGTLSIDYSEFLKGGESEFLDEQSINDTIKNMFDKEINKRDNQYLENLHASYGEKGVSTLSFDFKNLDNLNASKTFFFHITKDGNTLSFESLGGENPLANSGEDPNSEKILKALKYRIIISVPQKVKSCTYEEATIDKSRKVVTIERPLGNVLDMSFDIKF